MKIGKYNLTLKNIKAYAQGNYRLLLEKLDKLDLHIAEQVIYRESIANPECNALGECKCGCPVPDLYYADKSCDDNCYPEMMNQSDWNTFKTNKGIEIKIEKDGN